MKNTIKALEEVMVRELTTNLDLRAELKSERRGREDDLRSFFLGIIGIIDNIEAKDENLCRRYGEDPTGKRILKSYSSIKRQLLKLLNQYGVTVLTYPENKSVAGLCRVVDTEPDRSKDNDTILSVVRNGYIRAGNLIREAEVVVVKN